MEFLKVFAVVFAICSALWLLALISAWLCDEAVFGRDRAYVVAFFVKAGLSSDAWYVADVVIKV